MEIKICTKCGLPKETSEFNKSRKTKDGLRFHCRECDRIEGVQYRLTHREQGLIYSRAYSQTHKKQKQEYAVKNKERVNENKKRYVEKNPEKRKEQARRYYHNHKDRRKTYCNEHRIEMNTKRREYNQTHPQARIAHNLRSRIGAVLGGRSKGGRLYLLIGCDMDFFKSYLESLWGQGMNWGNYGKGVNKWSLDHIKPLEAFDLRDESEQKVAFYYRNMCPMWYPENAAKGSRYNGVQYGSKKGSKKDSIKA